MMPTVCAKDIAAVITYFDFTVDEGNPLAISAMKAMLGLPQINNLDDVAEIRKSPIPHIRVFLLNHSI